MSPTNKHNIPVTPEEPPLKRIEILDPDAFILLKHVMDVFNDPSMPTPVKDKETGFDMLRGAVDEPDQKFATLQRGKPMESGARTVKAMLQQSADVSSLSITYDASQKTKYRVEYGTTLSYYEDDPNADAKHALKTLREIQAVMTENRQAEVIALDALRRHRKEN